LGTTAIAALVALAVKNFPSAPTPFFHQFDAAAELQSSLNDPSIRVRDGGGSISFDPGSGRRQWDVSWHQNQRLSTEISDKYASRVEAALSRQGCKITGRRSHPTGFGYAYERGATSGEFFAEFVELGGGDIQLQAFCLECTRR